MPRRCDIDDRSRVDPHRRYDFERKYKESCEEKIIKKNGKKKKEIRQALIKHMQLGGGDVA